MSMHQDATSACLRAQTALDLLGRSRCAEVLLALLEGLDRYGAIRERCSGISDAVLSARLRELCQHGLSERTGEGRSARYRPTQACNDVRPVLVALDQLVERHPDIFLRDPSAPAIQKGHA